MAGPVLAVQRPRVEQAAQEQRLSLEQLQAEHQAAHHSPEGLGLALGRGPLGLQLGQLLLPGAGIAHEGLGQLVLQRRPFSGLAVLERLVQHADGLVAVSVGLGEVPGRAGSEGQRRVRVRASAAHLFFAA